MNNALSLFDQLFEPNDFYFRKTLPVYEIEESESQYTITMDIPGITKDSVRIEVTGNQLHVAGERQNKKLERFFTLPTSVDVNAIEATYEDGVLSIVLPKAESAKPRQIKLGEKRGTKVA